MDGPQEDEERQSSGDENNNNTQNEEENNLQETETGEGETLEKITSTSGLQTDGVYEENNNLTHEDDEEEIINSDNEYTEHNENEENNNHENNNINYIDNNADFNEYTNEEEENYNNTHNNILIHDFGQPPGTATSDTEDRERIGERKVIIEWDTAKKVFLLFIIIIFLNLILHFPLLSLFKYLIHLV